VAALFFPLAPLVPPLAENTGNPVATSERFELTLEATPHNVRQRARLPKRADRRLRTIGVDLQLQQP
jgi:hypothetical protein